MEYSGPYQYRLFLSGTKQQRFIYKKVQDSVVTNFKSPVTLKKTPKIYLLKYNNTIVYVGYAGQSIGTRLGQGIRASGTNGYYGYKWKQVSEIELLVFVFNKTLKGNKHIYDTPFIEFTEAVEAEIVFLIRQNTGQWPRFQNEIHFNNSVNTKERETVKATALNIYNQALQ